VATVEFRSVTKKFGEVVAVDDLSLLLNDGEFMVLVGPSGCGKTTALRMVAGLEHPTSGEIAIGDRVVNRDSPGRRDIAMVFQNYALYPHMSVERNIGFGLRQRKMARGEIAARVREVSTLLGLEDLLKRKPAQLSGGQRQRVAMGRALARRPQAFLLDEPLSNLDAKLRTQLRAELKKIHRLVPTTSIYVTHDQVEAMTLGDRIAVMAHGRIQQLGVPQDVYDEPANLFVAGFIGSPAMNLMQGTVSHGELDTGTVKIPARVPDGDVVLGVRPEHLTLAAAEGSLPTLEMTVDVVEPLGNEVMVHGWTAAEPYVGEQTGLRDLGGEGRSAVTARLDPGVRTAAGETLRLAFDPAAAHVFDADTGARLTRG
jgi:sn-glycerol 3-phosphate transport system ATP-binding protein